MQGKSYIQAQEKLSWHFGKRGKVEWNGSVICVKTEEIKSDAKRRE